MAEVPGTLDDAAVAALSAWVRERGIGSAVSDVEPLSGGTQNVVVRLCVDGRRVVLRRPPPHPRPNSNRTMRREIAVLQTLAGGTVPHPEFVAGCEDLDGFNPVTEVPPAYAADPRMRHQVGLNYAADLARLSAAEWQGRPLQQLHRPGSFLARQVPNFLGLLENYRHEHYRPERLDVGRLADWLDGNRPPDGEPGIMHGDPHLHNLLLRRDVARTRGSWPGRRIAKPVNACTIRRAG